MPLTDQERDRIREEEWVRLRARADFYKANPGWGPVWGRRWGGPKPAGFVVAIVGIVFTFALLANIAERINWNHILP